MRHVIISALLGVSAITAVAPAPAQAADTRQPAVVSLGDSYISGEGARWRGNSPDSSGSRGGTDRAYVAGPAGPVYDPSLVYGATEANGCHRADIAEVHSVPDVATINLACSGARTVHVLRARSGGLAFKGEQPQNDQLAAVARVYRVKAIALSIGGNDLGFGDIVNQCVVAYLSGGANPCSVTQQARVEQALPVMRAAVAATIDDIFATMAEAGYAPGSYQLVVQSYASPLPNAAQMRYPQAGSARAALGGCPFLDVDVDWGRSFLVGQLATSLGAVASAKGAQFLDLRPAFQGHELCHASAQQQPVSGPVVVAVEWVRWIDLARQGSPAESLHPNAFGHWVQGECLRLILRTTLSGYCQNDIVNGKVQMEIVF